MDTPPTRSKRLRPNEELDINLQTQQRQNFPRFIVVQAFDKETRITSLSPFIIEKQIAGILGTPSSIKNLRNGNILVEVNRKTQADNLLKTTTFYDIKVEIYPHPTLNSSRGVIRCREISDTPLDEIKKEMKKEGITDVKRITIKRNGKEIQTHAYIFTFDTPVLPSKVKIAYHYVNVEVYIPNPLQCFRCQKFGHHEDNCKAQQAVCGRCAKTGHTFRTCQDDEIQCANCQQDHQSNSRMCCFWKKEKEILRIKFTENLSFGEARITFENRNKIMQQNTPTVSYATISKPKPAECTTCKVLVDKLCQLFPEKAAQIRQLAQPSKDAPVPEPSQTTSKTLETNQSQNQKPKQPEQQTKPKVNSTPKQRLNLTEGSISKNSQVDSKKSTEKKNKKITRCVVVGDDVTIPPIPASSNKFQALSDMEDDSGEEESSVEFPQNENT